MTRVLHDRAARIVLGLLALSAAVAGPWAAVAPGSCYRDFRGGGQHWVAADGPFNEHLVRDLGGLTLALGAVTVLAAFRPEPVAVRLAGFACALSRRPAGVAAPAGSDAVSDGSIR
jgi:hypothetical protein